MTRARQARYEQTAKGRATRARYLASPKGVTTTERRQGIGGTRTQRARAARIANREANDR